VPRKRIIEGTISRKDFCAAIEAGIAAAESAPPGSVSPPRTWRARLRKVGRTASSVTAHSFENCPLTQAGLYERRPAGVFWDFAEAFDTAAKRAAEIKRPRGVTARCYALTVQG
jgi:hypothetical protein